MQCTVILVICRSCQCNYAVFVSYINIRIHSLDKFSLRTFYRYNIILNCYCNPCRYMNW